MKFRIDGQEEKPSVDVKLEKEDGMLFMVGKKTSDTEKAYQDLVILSDEGLEICHSELSKLGFPTTKSGKVKVKNA